MHKSDNNKLIIYGFLIFGGYLLINKIGNIFSSGKPSPGITTGLNPVFSETMSTHRKYRYTFNTFFAQNLAESIHEALGVFSDDFSGVMSSIKQATTQGDVFQIVQMFRTIYNMDLWSFLQTGTGITPGDGLSNNHLNEINDYVNSLPL